MIFAMVGRRLNLKARWGMLVEAYLTLVRHVSMRPMMTALRPEGARSFPA
jgi:hypothetical protein